MKPKEVFLGAEFWLLIMNKLDEFQKMIDTNDENVLHLKESKYLQATNNTYTNIKDVYYKTITGGGDLYAYTMRMDLDEWEVLISNKKYLTEQMEQYIPQSKKMTFTSRDSFVQRNLQYSWKWMMKDRVMATSDKWFFTSAAASHVAHLVERPKEQAGKVSWHLNIVDSYEPVPSDYILMKKIMEFLMRSLIRKLACENCTGCIEQEIDEGEEDDAVLVNHRQENGCFKLTWDEKCRRYFQDAVDRWNPAIAADFMQACRDVMNVKGTVPYFHAEAFVEYGSLVGLESIVLQPEHPSIFENPLYLLLLAAEDRCHPKALFKKYLKPPMQM